MTRRAPIALVALVVLAACGQSPTDLLRRTADATLNGTVAARTAFVEIKAEDCHAEANSFDSWRSCMAPAYAMVGAVRALDGAFRVAEIALADAEGDAWRDILAGALLEATRALDVMRRAGVDIPREVLDVIRVVSTALER